MAQKSDLHALTQKNIDTISRLETAFEATRTRGEIISDAFARCIGSWTFIIVQAGILGLWMLMNVLAISHHWDPYPFILLNLALSFQAAFTGPVIMISQNQQSRLIERRNKLDLQINLLSEQENTEILRMLKLLCEKAGIDPALLSKSDLLSQETKPDTLIHQIEKQSIEKKPNGTSQPNP